MVKLLTYGAGLMYLLLKHIALDVQVLRKGHRGEENVLMIQQCIDFAKGKSLPVLGQLPDDGWALGKPKL